MAKDILLLGSTDITRAVAETVIESGITLRAIVTIGEYFSISYNDSSITNARYADLSEFEIHYGIPIIHFSSYEDIMNEIGEAAPDLCLVAGWYHMVPYSFRNCFAYGCFGFHASLLPNLRGGAPLVWAILLNHKKTGVSLFQLSDGIDDGLLYGQESFPIESHTTISDLVLQSQRACVELTRTKIPAILSGQLKGLIQTGIPSYGLQRVPEDSRIEWTESAEWIDRLVRATTRPYPGAFTFMGDKTIYIWSVEPAPSDLHISGVAGQIANVPEAKWPCVVTGDGILLIREATDKRGYDYLDQLRRSSHRRFEN